MSARPPSAISGDDLRSLVQYVPSPVTVITAADQTEARGATIGSFTGVSLDPPLISFNVEKDSQIHDTLAGTLHFAVPLLGDEHAELCDHFAVPDQRGADQLEAVAYRSNEHGTPIFEAAPAVLQCRRHDAIKAGDHLIIVGWVLRMEERDETPSILYYNREYRSVSAPPEL